MAAVARRRLASMSLRQERVLALCPKFSSCLSMPCSMFLIYEVWCDHRKGKDSAVSRILVGMSLIDIMSSSAWFLSSWAVPKGTFAFSAGNRTTCNYQGFLLQLAIGAPLYNSSLALFYLLMIKYRWTDEQLAGLEIWVHILIIGFSVGTSIFMLPLGLYNHIGSVCWIIGEPQECGNSSFQPGDVPCERGNHAWLYGLSTFYGPLWACVIGCSVSMVVIYKQVRKTLRRASRYSFHSRSSTGSSAEDSRRIASQAILYTLSFLFTWMPSTLWSVAHWFNFSTFWLDLASSVCEPLQGLWNFSIFLRNRKETQGKLMFFLSKVFPFCIEYDAELYLSRPGRAGSNSGWRSTILSSIRSSNRGDSEDNAENSTRRLCIPVADLLALVDDDDSTTCGQVSKEDIPRPNRANDQRDEKRRISFADESIDAPVGADHNGDSKKRVSFSGLEDSLHEEWIVFDPSVSAADKPSFDSDAGRGSNKSEGCEQTEKSHNLPEETTTAVADNPSYCHANPQAADVLVSDRSTFDKEELPVLTFLSPIPAIEFDNSSENSTDSNENSMVVEEDTSDELEGATRGRGHDLSSNSLPSEDGIAVIERTNVPCIVFHDSSDEETDVEPSTSAAQVIEEVATTRRTPASAHDDDADDDDAELSVPPFDDNAAG